MVIFGVTLIQRRLFGRCSLVVRRRPTGRPVTARRDGTTAPTSDARAGPAPLAAPAGATSFLIGYAMLMFVPFAWSLITSFKTLPDSVQLSIIPDPFTLEA